MYFSYNGFLFKELSFELLFIPSPSLVLNYIKDCQSILEEVVSADRTKNNNKITKLSIKFTIPTDQLVKLTTH